MAPKKLTHQVALELAAGNAPVVDLGKMLGQTGVNLVEKALGDKGSSRPGHEVAGKITTAQLREIAERKLPDLNTSDVEMAMRTIAGTARSMGVAVVD
ncbi:uL11 family ribosomal protein [Amycolatopsis sp. WQ 127309]|uniref:uL11 family ribosomal protein n=1 Tax=Amycolatopsis sp. WQ 127309 TaxID=2932773 RepID=UPI001FF6E76E|nr:hypothetical protein [Amycolatopsis sp. WQ 127309]UOZ08400.1 hypothetical protein MUY22_09040 [Amycolatopsis sp. WQ 127309]